MKRKFAASLILLSAFTVSPDLLWRLKILLAQLTELLSAQQVPQASPAQIIPPPPLSRTPLSRTVLDSNFALNLRSGETFLEKKFPAPEIIAISPPRGGVGTTITIRGRGFTKTGNDVYASYGAFANLPSADGGTITLTVAPPGLPANLGAIKTATFPLLRYRFYIRNANGETKIPGEFVLDL